MAALERKVIIVTFETIGLILISDIFDINPLPDMIQGCSNFVSAIAITLPSIIFYEISTYFQSLPRSAPCFKYWIDISVNVLIHFVTERKLIKTLKKSVKS